MAVLVYIRRHLTEGHDWLREVVRRSAEEGGPRTNWPARVDTLVGLAVIACAQTAYDQKESLAVVRAVGATLGVAVALLAGKRQAERVALLLGAADTLRAAGTPIGGVRACDG